MSQKISGYSNGSKKKYKKNKSINDQLYFYVWGQPLSQQYNTKTFNLINTNDEKIEEIYPGENHLFLIKTSKDVFGLGDNSFNQISNKSAQYYDKPKVVQFSSKISIQKIFSGSDFSYLLTDRYEVYSFGFNVYGQLGQGHNKNLDSPVQVKNFTQFQRMTKTPSNSQLSKTIINLGNKPLLHNEEVVEDIVCGSLHTLVVTSKGRIFSCGFGETFALGHGNNQSFNHFKEIQHFSEIYQNKTKFQKYQIEKIDCGVSHSGILISKVLYIWGIFSSSPNHLYKRPTKISLGKNIVDFLLGDLLTVILTKSNEVFTFGDNIDGQLGIGESFNYITQTPQQVMIGFPVTYITGGLNHVIATHNERKQLVAWGSNKRNQISPFEANDKFTVPTPCPWLVSKTFAIKCHGNNTYYLSKQSLQVPNFHDSLNAQPESNKVEEKEKQKLKKQVESLNKKCYSLIKEIDLLKQENEKIQLAKINDKYEPESNKQTQDKSNYDTNDEINDSKLISYKYLQEITQIRKNIKALF